MAQVIKGTRKGEFLDAEKKIICKPQVYPMPVFDMKYVLKNIAKYQYHALFDGTIVHLYHHGGQWKMGSARSDDLSDQSYSTSKTFRELFNEVLEKYPEFSFDNLDTSKTFTVGFRHPDMHNTGGTMRAWTYFDQIGLEILEMQPLETKGQLNSLIQRGKLARYSDAKKGPEEPCLGFVLVQKTPGGKSFVLASEIWKVVKECQNLKVPLVTPEGPQYTKRAYMIARALVTFHNLARLKTKADIDALLPGMAQEVKELEARLLASTPETAPEWLKPYLEPLSLDKILVKELIPNLATL